MLLRLIVSAIALRQQHCPKRKIFQEEDAEMLDNWDAQSVGADEVAVDEDGNPLLDEYGDPIALDDPEKIEVCCQKLEIYIALLR